MATVYRVSVLDRSKPDLWTDTGETVVVEGEQFVRMQHGTIIPRDDKWHYSLEEAKRSVIPELKLRIDAIRQAILELE